MPGDGIGRLTVVCGPMFAGKSEELLRQVRRARLAGLAVEVYQARCRHHFERR